MYTYEYTYCLHMSYMEHGNFQITKRDDGYLFSVPVQVAQKPSHHGDAAPKMLDDHCSKSSDWCLGFLIFQKEYPPTARIEAIRSLRTVPPLQTSNVFQGCDHIGSRAAGALPPIVGRFPNHLVPGWPIPG